MIESKLETNLDLKNLYGKSIWQKIKDVYFEPKGFEKWENGRIYEWVGTRKIKTYLIRDREIEEGNRLRNNYFLQNRSVEGLEDFIKETRFNEGTHLSQAIIFISSISGIYVLFGFGIAQTAVAMPSILGAMASLHPIMIQRYNRTRIDNIIERMKSRKKYSH